MQNTTETTANNSLFDDIQSNNAQKEPLNFDFSSSPEDFTSDDDDFFSDFGQDFEGFETEEPTQKEEKARSGMHEAAARQYVQTFQIAISRLGMQYAKSSSADRYKLTDKEVEEYEGVTAAFFESIEWQPSPKAMFIGATLMLSLGVMAKAYADRQENIATERYQKAKQNWKNASTQAEAEAAAAEAKHFEDKAGEKSKRRRWQIDDNGYYINDESGKYQKQANRVEKPSKQILDLLKKYEYDQNGEKRTAGEVNAMIREELGLS